jgi:hypothetical protein
MLDEIAATFSMPSMIATVTFERLTETSLDFSMVSNHIERSVEYSVR